MAPWILIGVSALLGFVAGQFPGLLLGIGVGVLINILIGTVYNRHLVGKLPRRLRRTLALNLLTRYPDIVTHALPGLQGQVLLDHLEELIEHVGIHSARHAPLPQHTWSETAVTLGLADMIALDPSDGKRQLYRCMLEQMRQDWYPVNYLRGLVEP